MAGILILAFVVAIMVCCLLVGILFFFTTMFFAVKGMEGASRSTPQEVTKAGGFTLVYKEGKSRKSLWLQGNTESEAMAEALKMKVRYDQIVSLTKN